MYCKSIIEHLAQQLVSEQVEVIKHQALVDTIKQAIKEKKLSIIHDLINDQIFYIDHKYYFVQEINAEDMSDGFEVAVTLVELDPSIDDTNLTKRERELLAEYKQVSLSGCWCGLFELSQSLAVLKHGIKLVKRIYTRFYFDDASEPEFNEQSGIKVGCKGVNGRSLLLEDLIA